jgi:hypothetical protein
MKKHILASAVGVSLLLAASSASAQVYSPDFDSFVSGTDYFGGVSLYSYGYDADDTGAVYKALQYGQWGRAAPDANFIDVGAGDIQARANNDGKNNARLLGTFVDPSLFTSGSGTYNFSVDYTGADAGASWIYLYKATGVTTDGNNDLILDVANGGFGGFDPFNGTGAAVVTQLVAYNIADETQNEAYSVDFVYTAGDIIGIAFGSYNAAGTFDNVVIAVPEPSTYALLAGCFALAGVMIRRRR